MQDEMEWKNKMEHLDSSMVSHSILACELLYLWRFRHRFAPFLRDRERLLTCPFGGACPCMVSQNRKNEPFLFIQIEHEPVLKKDALRSQK